MSQAALLESLPPAARKHLDPASPMPARMMASKGLVPLPPRDMVIVLCGLALDADAKLVENARTSLAKLPDKLLGPALDADLPAAALGVLTPSLLGRDELLEKVALNRNTPDAALAEVATQTPARVVEILAENQERCMRSEPLVRAIKQNPNLLKSSLDRLFDFLVRAGVFFEDMPEFADSLARLSPTEMQAAASVIELPLEVSELLNEGSTEAAPPVADAENAEAPQEAAAEAETTQDAARIPMLKLVNSLNVAQKVALAIKGNKEARTILLRDSNRVVATAAIRNPRVTEQEVMAAAKSRQINDEVVRIICNSREMTRSYGVKLALVSNPKTPLPIALRFLSLLRANDLKGVAKSKNIPSAIAVQAKKLLLSKSSGGD